MEVLKLIEKSQGKILNEEIFIPNSFHHIVTDTRVLEKNDIFVALKGTNVDGNLYISEAIEKGAALIFTEENVESVTVPIVKVKDAYQCLRDLGSCYLETYQPFVIAVTGSVGKTTTKELIAQLLAQKYHVLKSEGNKNNRIGIPQTLFRLTEDIDCLVVELGMNHSHEIDVLSSLVKPNIAVITNIGSAHLGNLGSKKNILKAKMEITTGMDGGILLLNGKDRWLQKVKKLDHGLVKQVCNDNTLIQIWLLEQTIFGSTLMITNGIEKAEILFPNPGEAVIDDIALALQVGELLELSFQQMIEGIRNFQPVGQRFLVEQLVDGIILINDSYNSSYESLKMDMELLNDRKEPKVLILGDILELGKHSKKIHKKIGKEISKMKDTEVYLIGKEMKYAHQMCKKSHYFLSVEDFKRNFNGVSDHSVILVKGSRKMRLEEIVSYLQEKYSVM